MKPTPASSPKAVRALALVESLQSRFVQALEKLGDEPFVKTEWLRDEGRHGGGKRFGVENTALLGRASVNVSQVHYDDEPGRTLGSASAISTIVHPSHPLAPSVHIHISWTEMKTGEGYWRMMADLNPAIPNEGDRLRFSAALKKALGEKYAEAAGQGSRYFYIPALKRCRGVEHVYLETYNSGDFSSDSALAEKTGKAAIDTYIEILADTARKVSAPTEEQKAAQLAYHTLYFFQVLTLDRGTTSGLLIHNQNDVGILGSLPPKINRTLFASWRPAVEKPQDQLMDKLLAALPKQEICTLDDSVKQKLCDAVREFYRLFPDALNLQASGNTTPSTVKNHR